MLPRKTKNYLKGREKSLTWVLYWFRDGSGLRDPIHGKRFLRFEPPTGKKGGSPMFFFKSACSDIG